MANNQTHKNTIQFQTINHRISTIGRSFTKYPTSLANHRFAFGKAFFSTGPVNPREDESHITKMSLRLITVKKQIITALSHTHTHTH